MDIGWEGPRRLRECAGFVGGGGYAYPLTRGGACIARVIVWPVVCSRAVKVVYWMSHLEDHGRAGGPLVMPSWIAERYWGRVAASVERIVMDA